MSFAIGSHRPDIFALPGDIYDDFQLNRNTALKTPTSHPGLVDGQRTGVFIFAGQSLGGNMDVSTYVPTNPTKIDQINILDGGMYQAENPLVGCTSKTGGTSLVPMMDQLVSGGHYDRVIIVPVSIGGTQVTSWLPGAPISPRPMVAVARLAAYGLTPTAFLWQLGESDGALGVDPVFWEASMRTVIGVPRAQGVNCPWLIAKSTWVNGVVSNPLRGACDNLVNGTDILAGPDVDTLDNSYRADGTHLNPVGQVAAGTLWKNAIVAAAGLLI